MTFEIFKKTGEIHFDHNGIDDYDGDTGYDVNIEVGDKEVHDDVVTMIYDDCFKDSISEYCRVGYYGTLRDKTKEQIKLLLDNLEAWDSTVDMYKDELHDKYEEEYNRG